LTYSLLADEVFLDGSNIGWDVYEDTNAEETFNFHPLIQTMSDETASFVKVTDSSRNFLPIITKLQNPERGALTIATLEPMIWRSFARRGANLSSWPTSCSARYYCSPAPAITVIWSW
jgi:hypothetical protein